MTTIEFETIKSEEIGRRVFSARESWNSEQKRYAVEEVK